MARRTHKKADRRRSSPPPPAVNSYLGAALLAGSLVGSLMLALPRLQGWHPPGCGPGSACDRAAQSVWGSVPGLEWPTSFVGLAFFAGLLAAWLVQGGRLSPWLRGLARGGAVLSIVFVVAMVAGGYLCGYCLGVHAANLAFVVLIEVGARRPAKGTAPASALPQGSPRARAAAVIFGGLFIAATSLLAVAHTIQQASIAERDERELADTTQQIIERPAETAFTGRYRQGPEAAPIRLVIISDYQCPDCKAVEADVRSIMARRDDVSLSAKHFPFCRDCNRVARASGYSPHPNACWAALAAETAGILGGNDGFWRMHHWLFDRGGGFTDVEIRQALPGLGFDVATFVQNMRGPEPLRRVHADIEEAAGLGLRQTPMVFINGVELRGWRAPKAVVRAVEQIARTNPPPLTSTADHPPAALEKNVGDWLIQPVRTMPPDNSPWVVGRTSAVTDVVIWGDYQEPFTAELDGRVRAVVADNPAVRYFFRHYPIDQSCNPVTPQTKHPLACRAAQAAEAAGRLGGNDLYWRMHAWLMGNQSGFADETLRAAAVGMGLDADALFTEMDSTEVARAIREDATAAKSFGLRGVPFFFVGDRYVPYWRLKGERLAEHIIEIAVERAGG